MAWQRPWKPDYWKAGVSSQAMLVPVFIDDLLDAPAEIQGAAAAISK